MFASGYGVRVDEELARKLEEIRANPRYEDKSYVDENGGHHQRGGYWNNPERADETPFSKADVTELRASFKAIGLRLSWDQVDVLLSEAYGLTDYGAREEVAKIEDFSASIRDHWRAARARRIERLRAARLCIVDGKTPVDEGRTTCAACGRARNERRRRKKAKDAA